MALHLPTPGSTPVVASRRAGSVLGRWLGLTQAGFEEVVDLLPPARIAKLRLAHTVPDFPGVFVQRGFRMPGAHRLQGGGLCRCQDQSRTHDAHLPGAPAVDAEGTFTRSGAELGYRSDIHLSKSMRGWNLRVTRFFYYYRNMSKYLPI